MLPDLFFFLFISLLENVESTFIFCQFATLYECGLGPRINMENLYFWLICSNSKKSKMQFPKMLLFVKIILLMEKAKFSFYSAPQCSHCKRCTSYIISVRLSVRHTPVLCQTCQLMTSLSSVLLKVHVGTVLNCSKDAATPVHGLVFFQWACSKRLEFVSTRYQFQLCSRF